MDSNITAPASASTPPPSINRRTFLASGTALGASLLLDRRAHAQNPPTGGGHTFKEYDISTNGITLHVTEQGDGPVVLFVHGFPDTSYTWRRQMEAISAAGYRAIAPDMRGYGRSSAPADAALYTPLHTTGDLIGLLDSLNISSAVLVGHDWGATHAWNAALLRPDRFAAVFCLSVPYVPRGDVSVFERMRKSDHQNSFYMFEQIRPDADQIWLTPRSPFPEFCIGPQVPLRPTSVGVPWILPEVSTALRPHRYRRGRSLIMSLTTSLNFSALASMAA